VEEWKLDDLDAALKAHSAGEMMKKWEKTYKYQCTVWLHAIKDVHKRIVVAWEDTQNLINEHKVSTDSMVRLTGRVQEEEKWRATVLEQYKYMAMELETFRQILSVTPTGRVPNSVVRRDKDGAASGEQTAAEIGAAMDASMPQVPRKSSLFPGSDKEPKSAGGAQPAQRASVTRVSVVSATVPPAATVAAPAAAPAGPPKPPFAVKALFDYAASNAEELSLKAGDALTVTETPQPAGWWKAKTADGKVGVVPSNFVKW